MYKILKHFNDDIIVVLFDNVVKPETYNDDTSKHYCLMLLIH
jgi:hypothetical protein